MCAYNENGLMLTRIYPFATHDNHIQSQCTPLCDEQTTQEDDMREPPGAFEESEEVSTASAPVPTERLDKIRRSHLHGEQSL